MMFVCWQDSSSHIPLFPLSFWTFVWLFIFAFHCRLFFCFFGISWLCDSLLVFFSLFFFWFVSIYIDRFTQHRYKCDQAFALDSRKPPVAQYLDIANIVRICQENQVTAVHPGYGFLSENQGFCQALTNVGITFVGPTVANLQAFGDKTAARQMAIAAQVPVVAGSPEAFATAAQAAEWIGDSANNCNYPVIVKALMGGGGRGIRIVATEQELPALFAEASNEAATAFGDGRCFIEKYVEQPRHIEVQCLGDGTGQVVHLWDRDCSVQRRHQKVIELAYVYQSIYICHCLMCIYICVLWFSCISIVYLERSQLTHTTRLLFPLALGVLLCLHLFIFYQYIYIYILSSPCG